MPESVPPYRTTPTDGPWESWRAAIDAHRVKHRWSTLDLCVDMEARGLQRIAPATLREFLRGVSIYPNATTRALLRRYVESLEAQP